MPEAMTEAPAASFLRKISNFSPSGIHIIGALVFVGAMRLFLELLLSGREVFEAFAFPVLIHSISFYAGAFFLGWLLLSTLFPQEKESALRLAFLGIFAGLLPPIIDFLLPTSFYQYNYFIEFTPTLFSSAQPVGESITLWLLIFIPAFYFTWKTKRVSSFLLTAIGMYALIQFGGWLFILMAKFLLNFIYPALGMVSISVLEPHIFTTGIQFTLAQGFFSLLWFLIAFVAWALLRPTVFISIYKRPFAPIWGLLVLLGASIGSGITAYVVLQATLFIVAFVLVQLENDFYDRRADSYQGRESAIAKKDLILVRFFSLALIIVAFSINFLFGGLLAGAFLIGFLYNHPRVRLKKHFTSASLVEGTGAFLALMAGYLGFYLTAVIILELSLILFLSAGFALLSNVKDYKDVVGDELARICSLFVFLKSRGIPPQTTQKILLAPLLITSAASAAMYTLSDGVSPFGAVVLLTLIATGVKAVHSIKRPYHATLFAITHAMAQIILLILLAPLLTF